MRHACYDTISLICRHVFRYTLLMRRQEPCRLIIFFDAELRYGRRHIRRRCGDAVARFFAMPFSLSMPVCFSRFLHFFFERHYAITLRQRR